MPKSIKTLKTMNEVPRTGFYKVGVNYKFDQFACFQTSNTSWKSYDVMFEVD